MLQHGGEGITRKMKRDSKSRTLFLLFCGERDARRKVKKLYLISQEDNADYDTYDSAVVCAESEEAAKRIHPKHNDGTRWDDEEEEFFSIICGERRAERHYGTWTLHIRNISVEEIGVANNNIEEGIVISSFKAG